MDLIFPVLVLLLAVSPRLSAFSMQVRRVAFWCPADIEIIALQTCLCPSDIRGWTSWLITTLFDDIFLWQEISGMKIFLPGISWRNLGRCLQLREIVFEDADLTNMSLDSFVDRCVEDAPWTKFVKHSDGPSFISLRPLEVGQNGVVGHWGTLFSPVADQQAKSMEAVTVVCTFSWHKRLYFFWQSWSPTRTSNGDT